MNAPADFPLEEYEALRRDFGCVELAGWTSITLTGKDRQTLLNNFCTNDVKRLQPGERCEAFILNVKGKILGHGLVDCRAEELVFITVPGQAEKLIAHLDRYIIREDVQLRDTTAERKFLLLAGGTEAGSGLVLSEDFYNFTLLSGRTESGAGLGGVDWIRWRLLNVPICGLLEIRPEQWSTMADRMKGSNATICSQAAFESSRIESGTPLYGIDFNEENLPQEVGRDEEAISFTKGCYLGQETVARIDALGHVNQELVGVRFAGDAIPAVGTELTSGGAAAGRVTSAAYSPLLTAPLALAMVRRAFAATGTKLESAAGECEVVDLPAHV